MQGIIEKSFSGIWTLLLAYSPSFVLCSGEERTLEIIAKNVEFPMPLYSSNWMHIEYQFRLKSRFSFILKFHIPGSLHAWFLFLWFFLLFLSTNINASYALSFSDQPGAFLSSLIQPFSFNCYFKFSFLVIVDAGNCVGTEFLNRVQYS